MSPIDYFKLQAKKLFKDYKTQTVVDEGDFTYFTYSPTFFDIDQIFIDYDWDEENFSLMKAQHLFAMMIGFNSWSDFLNAPRAEQELAKLLWDNQHKISLPDWEMYLLRAEAMNGEKFRPETKLEVFRAVFAEVEGHHNPFLDYRLNERNKDRIAISER